MKDMKIKSLEANVKLVIHTVMDIGVLDLSYISKKECGRMQQQKKITILLQKSYPTLFQAFRISKNIILIPFKSISVRLSRKALFRNESF